MSARSSKRWNKSKKSYHYWTGYDHDRLKEQKLPEKVKCGKCCKVKPCDETQFSGKQLIDVKKHIIDKGHSALLTIDKFTCRLCAPQQTMELFCIRCDKHKGLDEFAKMQRRTPDSAKCKICMLKQSSLEPGEAEVSEDDASNASDESPNDNDYEIADGMENMSVVESVQSSGGVSLAQTVTSSQPGWVEQKGRGFAHKTTATTWDDQSSLGRSFNPNAYAKSRATNSTYSSPSTVTGSRTMHNSASTVAGPRSAYSSHSSIAGPSSGAAGSRQNRSGWAKPRNPSKRPEMDIEEEFEGDDEEGFGKKETVPQFLNYESSDDDY